MNILIDVIDTQSNKKIEIFGDGKKFRCRMSDGICPSEISKPYDSYQAIISAFPIFNWKPDLAAKIIKKIEMDINRIPMVDVISWVKYHAYRAYCREMNTGTKVLMSKRMFDTVWKGCFDMNECIITRWYGE